MTRRNNAGPAFGVTRQAGVRNDVDAMAAAYRQSRNNGKQPNMPATGGNRRASSLGPVDERDGDFDPPGIENEVIDLNDDFSDIDITPPVSVRNQLQSRGGQLPQKRVQAATPAPMAQPQPAARKAVPAAKKPQSSLDYVQQAISFLDTAQLPLKYKIILESGTVDNKPVIYVIARLEQGNGIAAEDRIATLYTAQHPSIQYRLDDLADYWAATLDQLIDMPYDMVDLERAVIKAREVLQSKLNAAVFLADHIHDIATADMNKSQRDEFEHAWTTFMALLTPSQSKEG